MTRECIRLAHGEGGWLTRQLVERTILPRLRNPALALLADAAVIEAETRRLAFTTDSFVVTPLFFPGGDLGRLAVFGTVNDLVVAGARPRWLSLSFILEEGLELETLERILDSAAEAARAAQVAIVAGDTKVVPRGAADSVFVTTSGVGEIIDPAPPGPGALEPGDVLIVSGPVGRHGIAILAARENLGLTPAPVSDCANLGPLAAALRSEGIPIRAMRDATRGGVAAVLHEWAGASRQTMVLEELRVPVDPAVRGASELLGLDPLHVANEGTMVVAVAEAFAESALQALRATPGGDQAAVIGHVQPDRKTPVLIRRGLGRELPLDFPSGAPLPRIC